MEPQTRRMPRAERRTQILDAATRAFARAGYSGTGLDDVAEEAGITRVLLYRHFESKSDLYRAVLDRACDRLLAVVCPSGMADDSIAAMLRAASADPDGFRLLFRHAAREPEFREVVDGLRNATTEITRRQLSAAIPDGPWLEWAAWMVPTVVLEGALAWLDAGRPDPQSAARRIERLSQAVVATSAQGV